MTLKYGNVLSAIIRGLNTVEDKRATMSTPGILRVNARGARVAKENGRILRMGQHYGSVRHGAEYNDDIDDFAKTYRCLKCGFANHKRGN